MALIALEDIRRAAAVIAPHVHRTPLLRSRTLSRLTGLDVHLKCENLQKTGSFKPRGAVCRIAHLTPAERSSGVLAASAGNHAQGLAFAARAQGVPVTVVMPATASRAKEEATLALGARVIRKGQGFDEALAEAERIRAESRMTFVHPCTDPDMVAGAGTVGLEIVEDLPQVDAVIVPIGGGGLISGIAAAVKGLRPEARVWGVEPSTAPAMERSLAAGDLVTLESADSIADGMAGRSVFAFNLAHVQALCEGVRLVGEAGMIEAMRLLLERVKLVTEAAGAAPVAALLDGVPALRPGSRVVAVLSGGNVDLEKLARWLRDGV